MPKSSSSPSGHPDASHQSDAMAPQDTKAPFLRIPWIASQINRPGVICKAPNSRDPKSSTEDSLWAEILKDTRTIRSCICFYKKPAEGTDYAEEVSTAITVGNGMNGHPAILHGGITATMLDEAMGIYQSVNHGLAHVAKVKCGKADGELPPDDNSTFTAELKIKYLRPVQTPGNLVVTVRRVKKEGRKEWLVAELKQCTGQGEDYDGDIGVCATGDALFIAPRTPKL